MMIKRLAKFALGQRVHHRDHPLRGLVIDVDAACIGPYGAGVDRDQPFYHLAAIGPDGGVFAYVPESSLEADALSVELTPEEVGLGVQRRPGAPCPAAAIAALGRKGRLFVEWRAGGGYL